MSGKRRIRVLHAVGNLHAGGLERMVADLVRRTDPQRFELHVMMVQRRGRGAAALADVAAMHDGVKGSALSLLRPMSLAAQIRRIAPDVVHTHSGVWYKTSRAARMAGVRWVVHTDHGRLLNESRIHRFLDRQASRQSHVIVAVSAQLKRDLCEHIVAFPSRVRVILNGVDTGQFSPNHPAADLRGTFGIAAGAPVLGTVGRLDPIKGFGTMIRALRELREGWTGGAPAPELVIVGEGPEEADLRALTGSLGLERAVHFLGWREDVAALYRAFTVFTLSSISEGTSISLLEAMSCGVCPVVTDVGGNRALLGPDLAHRLAPSGDPVALAAGWRGALQDGATRERDARAVRARVLEHFDLAQTVKQYEDLYLEPWGNHSG